MYPFLDAIAGLTLSFAGAKASLSLWLYVKLFQKYGEGEVFQQKASPVFASFFKAIALFTVALLWLLLGGE